MIPLFHLLVGSGITNSNDILFVPQQVSTPSNPVNSATQSIIGLLGAGAGGLGALGAGVYLMYRRIKGDRHEDATASIQQNVFTQLQGTVEGLQKLIVTERDYSARLKTELDESMERLENARKGWETERNLYNDNNHLKTKELEEAREQVRNLQIKLSTSESEVAKLTGQVRILADDLMRLHSLSASEGA